MIYVGIFLAKLLEVAITTVRVVLTARGNRIVTSILAAVEVTLWIIVTSTVLLGLREDPLRAVVYGVAFVAGIFLGIVIEDKLAFGLSQIEIIAEHDEAIQLANDFRGQGYGVTTFLCEGLEGKKLSIQMKVQRKDIPVTMGLLKGHEQLFVSVTDIRKLTIGKIGRAGKRMLIK
jgi:uncharacterized protein YebE (UPF0316 family)